MHLRLGVSVSVGNNPRSSVLRRAMLAAATAAVAVSALVPAAGRAEYGPPTAHADDHLHRPVAADASLRLIDAVEAALSIYPALAEAPARDEEAQAWKARGGSLIAGAPQLSFRYQTDRYDNDVGLQEFETGLQLPLWRWGQRRAVRDFGSALDAASTAWHSALAWEVAGRIRQVFWDMALAAGEIDIAQRTHDVSNRLVAAVERRHELGDVALGDLLLAQTAQVGSRTALNDAEAALVDAERAYRVLTGLDRHPHYEAEARSPRHDILPEHPALVFVTAEVERTRAAQTVARDAARTAPTLTIGPRRERPASGQAFEDSVGVIVTIPFGGGTQARTQEAAAGRSAASAEAARRQAIRELELELHEAEHGLQVTARNLADAERRVSIAERAFAMAEAAYGSGEIGVFELLNMQNLLLEAQRQRLRYDVEAKRLVAMYNQAVGVLP